MSEDNRSCTCHPDDSPPVPCARRYALNECRQAELTRLRAELARVQQECERLREYEQKWNALQEAVRKLSDLHERATRIANAPQMHPPVMLDAKAPPA